MSKAIRTKAKELLGYGLPKQAVFDTIVLEHPEAKPRKVADLLRYMPSELAKERFGPIHRALLATILLSAVLRVVHPLLDRDYDWANAYMYVSLIPIATLLVGWSIYCWQGQVLKWVGWGNVAGAGAFFKHSAALASGDTDLWTFAFAALPVLIGALSLVLAYGAFPGYTVTKDPLGAPERFVFKAEAQR